MMSASIRRKVLSLCSNAVANNGIVQSLERAQPALVGSASRGYVAGIPMLETFGRSKVVPEFHQGMLTPDKSLSSNPVLELKTRVGNFNPYTSKWATLIHLLQNELVQVILDLQWVKWGKSKMAKEEAGQIGVPVYSKSLRDSVSSLKADFPSQKWIRSFSTYSEPAEIEKTVGTSVKKSPSGPAYFTASGAVVGSVLSTPIVNAPQAAKLGMGSTATTTFLPNLALFWHMNNGIEEILADYVHHEMTRSLVLVLMRLFLIVAAKDVFVATN